MVKELDDVVNGKRRDSFLGDEIKQHDALDAQRLLKEALKRLELNVSDLQALKKSDSRKKAAAWLIRKRTCVRNEWIAQSLEMGCLSNVSNFIRQVDEAEMGILFELKSRLK